MLSHKQIWRRTSTKRSHSNNSLKKCQQKIPRTSSDPTGCNLNNLKDIRSKSTNDLIEKEKEKIEEEEEEKDFHSTKKQKQVRFSETSRVVLVPCLNEYRSHGLHSHLWWENQDYNQFKSSAKLEISEMLLKYGGEVKDILKYLYQHNININNNDKSANNNITAKEEINNRLLSPSSISLDLERLN